MKKMIALFLSLVMVLALGIPAMAAEDGAQNVQDYYKPGSEYPEVTDDMPELTIKIAHGNSEEQECHVTLLRLADLLDERTNGKVKLEIYPNQQMGTDVEAFQSMLMGDIEAVWQTTIIGANYIADDSVFDLSMYYTDMDQLNENLTGGDLRNYFQQVYRDTGAEVMAMYCYGFRTLTSNTEVDSIDDFKGLDIRTMQNTNHMNFWKALGCNPTALAWGEVYLALQQGLLDAEENPMNAILTNNMGEVQKYIYNTNHLPFIGTIVMNEDFYQSLPDEYKIIFKVSVADAVQAALDLYEDDFEASLEGLSEQGCSYVELGSDLLQEMVDVASTTWDDIFSSVSPELKEICDGIFG